MDELVIQAAEERLAEFRKNIKAYKKASKVTVEELAIEAGVSYGTMSNFLSGSGLSSIKILVISMALGIPL